MAGNSEPHTDSRFPPVDTLDVVQRKAPTSYSMLSPPLPPQQQQEQRHSGCGSASKKNFQCEKDHDDDGRAFSNSLAKPSVPRLSETITPCGEQISFLARSAADGGSGGDERDISLASYSLGSCQDLLTAAVSPAAPSGGGEVERQNMSPACGQEAAAVTTARLSPAASAVPAETIAGGPEKGARQRACSGGGRGASVPMATADPGSASILAADTGSRVAAKGKTKPAKQASPGGSAQPPPLRGRESAGAEAAAIGDASASEEDDTVLDNRAPDTSNSAAAEAQETLVLFTDENIESQLQKLKLTLDYLIAEKNWLSEAEKLEPHFALVATSMSKDINPNVHHRTRTAKVLLDNGLCQLVISYWKALDMKSKKDWYQKKGNRMTSIVSFYRLLAPVAHGADLRSHDILAAVARDLLDFVMDALDSDALNVPTKMKLHSMVVKGMLSILHNVVRRFEGGVEAVRSRDGVRIVGKHAMHGRHATKAKAIFVLSQIITEDDQKHLLAATDSHMEYLVTVLRDCVAAGPAAGYRSATYGYVADDLLEGLNRMAAALDSNKLRIIRSGALPLYVALMGDRCSREQQAAACRGVWTLAFCKENRELFLENPTCMEALRRLTASNDPHVNKAAKGALWVIEEEEKRVQGLSFGSSGVELQGGGQHIMMSYNWSVQEDVLKVRDRLKAAGYNIWIDVEKMSGSTLEAMAKSIENAAVVLIFFNEKYKHSAACRSEAEYTYKLGKQFIPIRMQPKYIPDGWLGMLLGTKFFFDLSKVDRWENTVQAILKELSDRSKDTAVSQSTTNHELIAAGTLADRRRELRGSDDDPMRVRESLSVPSSRNQPPGGAAELGSPATAAHERKTKIEGWTHEQIRGWLKSNNLDAYAERFSDFSGRHLLELQRMLAEAPAYCYAALEQQLGLKLPHLLSFTSALRELSR